MLPAGQNLQQVQQQLLAQQLLPQLLGNANIVTAAPGGVIPGLQYLQQGAVIDPALLQQSNVVLPQATQGKKPLIIQIKKLFQRWG